MVHLCDISVHSNVVSTLLIVALFLAFEFICVQNVCAVFECVCCIHSWCSVCAYKTFLDPVERQHKLLSHFKSSFRVRYTYNIRKGSDEFELNFPFAT